MGAHPAYGKQVRASRGKEEDYGSRGLHRRAGTIKHEGFENRGTGHAEDYDARYEAAAFKGKDEARRGRKVMMNQTIREREAAARRKRAGDAKVRSHGFSEVRGQPDEEDLDVSPGAAGGSKRSKQDPTTG